MQAQNESSFDERRTGGMGTPGSSPTTAAGAPVGATGMPGSASASGSEGGSGVAHQAAQVAGQVAEKAQQTTGQVVDQVRQQANTRLAGQIGQGSHMLREASQAVAMVGEQLRQKDQPMLAGYADQLADRVERVSGYLQGKDLDAIVDDTERLARRRPGLFLGSAFTLGLLAARFLKSSTPRPSLGGQQWPDYRAATGYPNAGPSYGSGYGYGTTGSGYVPPASPGYGTTNTGYGTTGSTPTGAGYGTTGGAGYGGGTGTSGVGSAGVSGGSTTGQRSPGTTDRPYPAGATGGAEPEPGYTPTI